mgnify:FL=1
MFKKFFTLMIILGFLSCLSIGTFSCGGNKGSPDESSVEREMERADDANKELERE